MDQRALAASAAMVCPRRSAALLERRLRVEAARLLAMLGKATWMIGLSEVSAIASRRWPLAAARVSVMAEGCAKSALPEITALKALVGPGSSIIFYREPVLGEYPQILGDVSRAERKADRRIGENDRHRIGSTPGATAQGRDRRAIPATMAA